MLDEKTKVEVRFYKFNIGDKATRYSLRRVGFDDGVPVFKESEDYIPLKFDFAMTVPTITTEDEVRYELAQRVKTKIIEMNRLLAALEKPSLTVSDFE